MRVFPVNQLTDQEPVLYRLFDEAKRLLYVGSTVDVRGRLAGHSGCQPWWPDVAYVGVEYFATIEDAESAERAAIAVECPEHNVAGNVFRGMLSPLCVARWEVAA